METFLENRIQNGHLWSSVSFSVSLNLAVVSFLLSTQVVSESHGFRFCQQIFQETGVPGRLWFKQATFPDAAQRFYKVYQSEDIRCWPSKCQNYMMGFASPWEGGSSLRKTHLLGIKLRSKRRKEEGLCMHHRVPGGLCPCDMGLLGQQELGLESKCQSSSLYNI